MITKEKLSHTLYERSNSFGSHRPNIVRNGNGGKTLLLQDITELHLCFYTYIHNFMKNSSSTTSTITYTGPIPR